MKDLLLCILILSSLPALAHFPGYDHMVVRQTNGLMLNHDYAVTLNRFNLSTISAFFSDDEPMENGEPRTAKCEFTVSLSRTQQAKLRALMLALKFCHAPGERVMDAGFDGVQLYRSSQLEGEAHKKRFGYPENEVYLCRGNRLFYAYLRNLIVPKAPKSCPQNYQSLFTF